MIVPLAHSLNIFLRIIYVNASIYSFERKSLSSRIKVTQINHSLGTDILYYGAFPSSALGETATFAFQGLYPVNEAWMSTVARLF